MVADATTQLTTTTTVQDNLVKDPLGAIQLAADAATMASATADRGVDWGFGAILEDALQHDPRGVASIPLLTSQAYHGGQLKNHTLVRYRGMVSVARRAGGAWARGGHGRGRGGEYDAAAAAAAAAVAALSGLPRPRPPLLQP